MNNIWFTSDTHFGHKNFLNFLDDAGNKIRPFGSVEEMDELMVDRWNAVVKPGDKIYHLGDVTFGDPSILARLKGQKRLVLGNHDDIKNPKLFAAFKKVQLWRLFKEHNFVCTHVPMWPDQIRHVTYNVHGHIHHQPAPSDRHICICVEQTDYRPLHLDELLSRMK